MVRYNNVVRSKEAESADWAQRVETMTMAHELALQVNLHP